METIQDSYTGLRNLSRRINLVRYAILLSGWIFVKIGLVEPVRLERTTKLAWPRILTGLARMSRNAVDIAMVGIAIGPAAIAGVGFAGPFWSLSFVLGVGLAAGTIALVSQRFGADKLDLLGQAARTSILLMLILTIPVTALFWLYPAELISALTSDEEVIMHGATYIQLIGLGIPFAGLNYVGERILIGSDDAWTPMVLRTGASVGNIVLNFILIFGFDMGVAGAAIGTVLSDVVTTCGFLGGLAIGRLPGIGKLPVTVDLRGQYVHGETIRDLVRISTPVIGRNSASVLTRFPMLAFVGLFGQNIVAAYIISRRIWGLLNTPGWGFGLSASSLVGQSLGEDDEDTAERYGHEITYVAVGTYTLGSILVIAFAREIVLLFVNDPSSAVVPIAVPLVYAASFAVIIHGVGETYAGALDATGDTRWPFYSRTLGMVGCALPLTYLAATTSLGIFGLYLSFFGQAVVPAIINYVRFTSGKWKAISRQYRVDTSASGVE